jgi:hypothetical protein
MAFKIEGQVASRIVIRTYLTYTQGVFVYQTRNGTILTPCHVSNVTEQ